MISTQFFYMELDKNKNLRFFKHPIENIIAKLDFLKQYMPKKCLTLHSTLQCFILTVIFPNKL